MKNFLFFILLFTTASAIHAEECVKLVTCPDGNQKSVFGTKKGSDCEVDEKKACKNRG